MIFGPSGRDRDSPNQYHLYLETVILDITQENEKIILGQSYFGKSQNLGHRHFWKCWNRRGRQIPKIRLSFFEILSMRSISFRKHEITMLVFFGKDRAREILKIRRIFCWKSWMLNNIFHKTWNGNLVIWVDIFHKTKWTKTFESYFQLKEFKQVKVMKGIPPPP